MITKMFTIRDSKGANYGPPFCVLNGALAERHFETLVNDQSTMIHKFPEDFDLYELGEFDDSTGKCTLKEAPEHLRHGQDLVKV